MFKFIGKFWAATLVATLTYFGLVVMPSGQQPVATIAARAMKLVMFQV
jgi:hypothetical protein